MKRALQSRLEAGKLRTDAPGGFSLNEEMISAVFEFAKPLGHHEDRVTHYKLSNKEFFPRFESLGLPAVDLAFLDGNHAFENVREEEHLYEICHDRFH